MLIDQRDRELNAAHCPGSRSISKMVDGQDGKKLQHLKKQIQKSSYKPDTRKAAMALLLEMAKTQTQLKM